MAGIYLRPRAIADAETPSAHASRAPHSMRAVGSCCGFLADERVDGVPLPNPGSTFNFGPIATARRFTAHFRRDLTAVGDPGTLEFARPTVYPNPSHGRPMLGLSMEKSGRLEIVVYDISGRRLRTVARERAVAAGTYRLPLAGEDGARLRTGLYFYRAVTGSRTIAGRFVVVE
jgi:hypothetical protein